MPILRYLLILTLFIPLQSYSNFNNSIVSNKKCISILSLAENKYAYQFNPYLLIDDRIRAARTAISEAEYTKAAGIFTELIPVVKRSNNSDYIGTIYSYLSLVHRLVENPKEALTYGKEAKLYLSKSENPMLKIWGEVCLGSSYFINKDYELASNILNQAINAFEKNNTYRNFIVFAYSDLAAIELSKGYLTEATSLYYKAIANKDNYHKGALINSYTNLGKIYIAKNEIEKAHDLFCMAYKVASEQPDKTHLARVYTQKARFLKDIGNYKSSTEYYAKVDSLWSDIINNQARNEVQQVANDFLKESLVSQAEIEKQQAKIVKLQLQKKTSALTSLIAILLFVVSALLLGIAISKKKRAQKLAKLEQQVSHSKEQLLHNYIKGQEEERNRMARDLHDGIGSQMAILKMQLSSIKSGDYNHANLAMFLCDDIYQGLRDVAFNLMPRPLVKNGIASALQELTRKLRKSTGIDFCFKNYGLHFRPPYEVESALFRIVQEVTANIVKHSKANTANIDISYDNESLGLTITYNGQGFNPDDLHNSKGYGWKNINTRLERINGIINIDSSEHQDQTTVLVEIPLKTDERYAKTG